MRRSPKSLVILRDVSSGEKGDGDDGSPEVGEVAVADGFSGAFDTRSAKSTWHQNRQNRCLGPNTVLP